MGPKVLVNGSDGKDTVPNITKGSGTTGVHQAQATQLHLGPEPSVVSSDFIPLVLLSLISTVCVYFFIRSYFPSTVPGAEDVDLGRSDVVPAFIV